MPLDGQQTQQLEGFRLPGARDRHAIFGRTGTGKTHLAVWALSHQNWDKIPWLIVDYKPDPLIAEIPILQRHRIGAKLPKEPGLYHVHPDPRKGDEVEELLWSVWKRGRIGLYADEGFRLPDREAFQAILQQGRSKGIPVIMLAQRPVWLNRFTLSEAGFFSVFSMNDRRDRKTIESFLPGIDLDRKLPRRHSYYYDVAEDRAFLLGPVPPKAEFMQRFKDRNPRHQRLQVI